MPSRYEVLVAPSAIKEIIGIGAYIKEESPQAVARLADFIEEGIVSLETLPLRSPLIPENAAWGSEFRHLIKGQYRVIFRVEGRNVKVLKVIHGARLMKINPGKP